MLSGTRYLTVDGRGRLVIPEHFARQLGEALILTHAPGGCLLLMGAKAWGRFLRRQADPERREFFLAGAETVQRNEQGRVQLPAALRHYAGLQAGVEAAVAGVGHAVCLSPAASWDARLRRVEKALLAELDRPAPPLWTDRVLAAA